MLPSRRMIGIGILISATCIGSAQIPDGQWLIEHAGGVWEVREKGQKDRQLSEKYDVLTATSQVRCLKLPCTLDYTTDGRTPKRLFATAPVVGRWVPVPQPTEPPVARTAAELQQLIGKAGVRGGADKESPVCKSDLPVLTPICNETIDPTDFTLRWTPRAADAGKTYSLFVGGADSSERRRWNGIAADSGEFENKALRDYLVDLQLPDRATDVTIRLMRTETLEAVRLVRLQSRAEDAEYRKNIESLAKLPELARNLALLEKYLRFGMSSKAADIARALLRDAPESLEIRKYALVGYCQSDFASEIVRLRNSLTEAGVTGICQAEKSVK